MMDAKAHDAATVAEPDRGCCAALRKTLYAAVATADRLLNWAHALLLCALSTLLLRALFHYHVTQTMSARVHSVATYLILFYTGVLVVFNRQATLLVLVLLVKGCWDPQGAAEWVVKVPLEAGPAASVGLWPILEVHEAPPPLSSTQQQQLVVVVRPPPAVRCHGPLEAVRGWNDSGLLMMLPHLTFWDPQWLDEDGHPQPDKLINLPYTDKLLASTTDASAEAYVYTAVYGTLSEPELVAYEARPAIWIATDTEADADWPSLENWHGEASLRGWRLPGMVPARFRGLVRCTFTTDAPVDFDVQRAPSWADTAARAMDEQIKEQQRALAAEQAAAEAVAASVSMSMAPAF